MRCTTAVLALGLLLTTNASAFADWFSPCFPPCCVTYELRPVVCYRPEWREEQVPCVVERVNYRREATPVRVQVMVPRMFDEQVRTACYVPTPREVEREIWRCVVVPVVAVDPWTCCPCVTYTSQWVRLRVRCVEYEYRVVERVDTTERVPLCAGRAWLSKCDSYRRFRRCKCGPCDGIA